MGTEVNYTVKEICLLGDFSNNVRKYKSASEMEWLGGIGTTTTEEASKNLEKYGIIDRRWNLNEQLTGAPFVRLFPQLNNFILTKLEDNNNYFGELPHFLANFSTLKRLGCPKGEVMLFKVRKIAIPNVGSILKIQHHTLYDDNNQVEDVTLDVQRLLSIDHENRDNKSFSGIYASKLSKPDAEDTNKEIRILLTNTLDGVKDSSWTANQIPEETQHDGLYTMDFNKEDVLKVKSCSTAVFYGKRYPYFYENMVARESFLNGFLIGAPSFLCGVYTKYERATVLNEVWEKDVSKLEMNSQHKNETPNWDERRFPKSIFGNNLDPENTFQRIKKKDKVDRWTKNQCMNLIYSSLNFIRDDMENFDCGDENHFYLFYSFGSNPRWQPTIARINFSVDDSTFNLKKYLTGYAVEVTLCFSGTINTNLWEKVKEILGIARNGQFQDRLRVEEIGSNKLGIIFEQREVASEFLKLCKTNPAYEYLNDKRNQITLKINEF